MDILIFDIGAGVGAGIGAGASADTNVDTGTRSVIDTGNSSGTGFETPSKV